MKAAANHAGGGKPAHDGPEGEQGVRRPRCNAFHGWPSFSMRAALALAADHADCAVDGAGAGPLIPLQALTAAADGGLAVAGDVARAAAAPALAERRGVQERDPGREDDRDDEYGRHWSAFRSPGRVTRCVTGGVPGRVALPVPVVESSPRSNGKANPQVTAARVKVPLGHEPFGHDKMPPRLRVTGPRRAGRSDG